MEVSVVVVGVVLSMSSGGTVIVFGLGLGRWSREFGELFFLVLFFSLI